MIEAVKKCVAGLDVHKKTVMCTILTEKKRGILKKITREFSTFRDDLNRLAKQLYALEVGTHGDGGRCLLILLICYFLPYRAIRKLRK